MHTQTLLATVSDRQVAALLAEIDQEIAILQRRVAALEGNTDADAARIWFAPDAGIHLGVGGDLDGSDDGPDLLALTLGGKTAAALVAADFGSLAAVRAATDAQLRQVVDAKTLKSIRTKLAGVTPHAQTAAQEA